jgi:hypothetical protein
VSGGQHDLLPVVDDAGPVVDARRLLALRIPRGAFVLQMAAHVGADLIVIGGITHPDANPSHRLHVLPGEYQNSLGVPPEDPRALGGRCDPVREPGDLAFVLVPGSGAGHRVGGQIATWRQ